MSTLEEQKVALAELEEALKSDPKNAELLALKSQLLSLIGDQDKVKGSTTTSSPPSSPPAPTHEPTEAELKVGTAIFAQWSSDGIWYEATIAEVKGPNAFLVTYSGYGNQEERSREFIRLKGTTDLNTLNSSAQKRKPVDAKNGRDANGKKTKRKKEDKAAANWRAFTTTGLTMKTSAPTKKKDSIFKSPDSVTGKVGVTGSGKE